MEKILVSACLLGEKCTFDGRDNGQPYLKELNRYYDIVPFCPEVEGGLPCPRDPSEIKGFQVLSSQGKDVTSFFQEGAYKACSVCDFLGIRLAIMKEASPSCGVHQIHDGYFRNRKVPGEGVTVAALRRQGVTVLNEEEGLALLEKLKKQEQIKDEKTRIAKAKESRPLEEEPVKEEPKFDKERKPFRKDRPFHSKPFQGKGRFVKKDHDAQGDKPHGEKKSKPFGKKPFGKEHRVNGAPAGRSFQGKTRPFNQKKRYPRKPREE